jgi:hypothetical protein
MARIEQDDLPSGLCSVDGLEKFPASRIKTVPQSPELFKERPDAFVLNMPTIRRCR